MDTRLEKVRELIENKCKDEKYSTYFFVSCDYKENQHKLEVFIDGDEGVSLGVLAHFTRYLRTEIELDSLFEEELRMEVSSPGIGAPITTARQFRANIGRLLEFKLKDGKQVNGRLMIYNEESIFLEIEYSHKPGAKVKKESMELSPADIEVAKAIVSFK